MQPKTAIQILFSITSATDNLMIKTSKYTFLCLVFILLAFSSQGQSLMYLQEGQLEYSLGKPVQILEDPTNSLTFEQVRQAKYNQRFKKSNSDKPNPGFNDKSYWYRFKVYNVAGEQFRWLLDIGFPGLDTIEVYQIHKTGEVEKVITGDLFPFNDRIIKQKGFLIPLHIRGGETLSIYVRVAGISTKLWDSRIIEQSHFLEKSTNTVIINILISGIILGLFVYNLLLFLGTKQKGYLYYISYLFAFWVTQLFIQGYAFLFVFRDSPEIANVTTNFIALITLFLGSIFSRVFLNIPEIAPKLNKGVKTIEFISLIASAIQLSAYFHRPAYLWSFSILNIMIYSYLALFITMGIIALRKNVDTARFYAYAWGFTIFGVVTATLKTNGIVESNLFTDYALSLGVIMQAALFSFGLANRINVSEKERRKAQEASIKALQENERIVRDQNIVLERLVQERTEELNANLDTVSNQKLEIERKNRNIMASITYASRIQKSILPTVNDLHALFRSKNAFIFYRPKDIVSGDFYWARKRGDHVIFAVIDCTGHGVPGALMGMVGYDLLNNAVLNNALWQPAEILESMQKGLDLVLRQHQRKSGDGMAISLCTYDLKQKKLYFSGARHPLLYFQDGEMKLIKGELQSIGGYKKHIVKPHPFPQHELAITSPTSIYLYSDGFQDQFGSSKNKKFMAGKFRKLIQEIEPLPSNQQEIELDQVLSKWMYEGNERQMDDITIIGIKIEP